MADVNAVEAVLQRSTGLEDFYAMAGEPEAKKELLQTIIRRIHIEKGAIKKIEYHEPFHLVLGDGPTASSEESIEEALLRFVRTRGGT
jgi:hypothetical protein